MSVAIERMAADHVDGIAAIERESFSRPWTKEGIAAELDSKTAVFFVASEGGCAVGYIGFHVILDEGYMANLAVLPQYRRRGIARALLEEAVRYCENNGVSFLSLEVRRSNTPAIDLYRSFGFEKVGERKRFYHEPEEDADIMTRLF